MSTTVWLIDPFDPLIVADGRPFNNDPGARATSFDFPPPSVTAGGLRTRYGFDLGGDFTQLIPHLLDTAVGGALLVRLASDAYPVEQQIAEWYVPAPADALIRQEEEAIKCYRLQPLDRTIFPPAQTDLGTYALVGSSAKIEGKSPPNLPRLWSWRRFSTWITAPHKHDLDLAQLGDQLDVVAIERDVRTHVQIEPQSQRADEGMLFQTQGLSLHGTAQHPYTRFAFAVWSNAQFAETVAPLGGERRLMHWHKSTSTIPTMPASLIETIVQTKHCRLILLTPAYWQNGFYPQRLPTYHAAVTPTIVGIANQRPYHVSGWDFEHDRPKATRRLASAGTVLFVRLDGDEQAIREWITKVWFQPLNDTDQANHDGFGIIALGTWDGEYLREVTV